MNFLNSIILYGLGAAALPFIIHLLFRRRPKDVNFPSIKLLELMKTDRIRRLRIKQILILLLRTLIILLIILAFARPAVRGVFNRNARTAAVIVIDSSASMYYIHNGEVLFDTAVRKAREILEMLGSDDTAALILTGEPRMPGGGMTARKTALVKALENVEPLHAGNEPERALVSAVEMLETSGFSNRELYYLTDGAVNSLPDSLKTDSDVIRLYTVLLGPEKRDGPVVENLELINRLVVPGANVTFRADGFSGMDNEETNIEFFINDERKARVLAEKRPGNRIEAEFDYTPGKPGWYSVYASVSDGRYELGETRRIVMHVPGKVNILIAGESPDDLYFLQRILEPVSEPSMFALRTVLYDRLKPEDFTMADVIVLSGVPSLPGQIYNSIRNSVVERGAGLVVFTPENMDSSLYENGIFRDIFPLKVERYVSMKAKQSGGFALIDRFDMNHPVLRGVSDKGDFQKPKVSSYYVMRPLSQSTSVIARFSDGSMAVGETPCGKGRAVVFSVDATTAGSELPMTGIFVPLFIRIVQYLSETFVTGSSYVTGEPAKEIISNALPGAPVTIKPEDGPARSVNVSFTETGTEIEGETAGKPGFYSVYAGTEEQKRFSVNTPQPEIFFQRAGNTMMSRAYKGIKWEVIEGSGNLTESVINSRYGAELFGMFIMLALVVTGVEMVLSRKL